MASGSDEKEASVDPEIGLFTALGLLLLAHVGLMLIIDEIDDGSPRVTVVDIVSETGGVDDGQLDLEGLFFKLRFDNFDLKRDG